MIFRGTGRTGWFVAIRRYLAAMAIGNLVWETAQLPLYTMWRTGTPARVAAAVVHCTVGDIAIAIVMLVVALVLFGSPAWPDEKFRPVLMAALAGGIGYTIYSEFVNRGRARRGPTANGCPPCPGSARVSRRLRNGPWCRHSHFVWRGADVSSPPSLNPNRGATT